MGRLAFARLISVQLFFPGIVHTPCLTMKTIQEGHEFSIYLTLNWISVNRSPAYVELYSR